MSNTPTATSVPMTYNEIEALYPSNTHCISLWEPDSIDSEWRVTTTRYLIIHTLTGETNKYGRQLFHDDKLYYKAVTGTTYILWDYENNKPIMNEEPNPFNPVNKEYVSWDYAKTQPHDISGIEHPDRYKYWRNNGIYYPAFSSYTIPS